uniref:Uncharacterized protein n=1 Tax=Gasterosteus aculeatus TaxID=69293 RepID=G3NAD3_GASAC
MTTHPVANMSLAVPLEEQFKCCICLDIFTHPTSIPCGHNFCLECIEGFWDTKRKPECPLCKEKFKKRPSLKINCGFAEIIEIYKSFKATQSQTKKYYKTHLCGKHRKPLTKFCTSDQKPVCVKCTEREHKHHTIVPIEKERNRVKTSLRDKKTSIKQMIHARRRKMEQINNSVDLSKKKRSNKHLCLFVIHKTKRFHCVNEQKITEREIQKNQARLVEKLEQKHQEAERRAAELLQELQQEIRELQARGIELVQLEQKKNMISSLTAKDCCNDQCMKINFFFSLFSEVDRLNQYAAVDVTLDPETASGWLVLSPDRKKVAVGSQKNNLVLDSPRRFNSCVCVLGKQSFATGRRYWVVQVGNKTDWDLGVARESINRKGAIAVRPDSGYWAICRRKGAGLNACAGPSVKLCLKETPQKVGVFLDYDEGLVSFYDAEAKTHIYTYSGCDFNEPLNPYFNPCVPDEGKNIAPLIICPVEESVH